jgi:N-acetylmuramoyl-L-alanine amidase
VLLTKERKMQKTRFLTIAILMTLVTTLVGCSSEKIFMPEIVGSVRYPTCETTFPQKAESVPEQLGQDLRGRIIVVDAGHGGRDPECGEVGYSRLPEKTLVLAIAKEMVTQLKACGARIIMTRTADYFVPLDDRAEIADKHKADLLLSIHIDSCPKGYVSGKNREN